MTFQQLEGFEKKILSELRRFQLKEIEPEWVKEVFDNDFQKFSDLPLLYEEIIEECNFKSRCHHAQEAIEHWLELNQTLRRENGSENVNASSRPSLANSQLSDGSSVNNSSASNLEARLWSQLFPEQTSNSFLALLGFFIEKGGLITSNSQDRQKCFAAAKLYLTIISMPGSMAFRIFHQVLYMKALQLVQLFVQTNKYRKITTTAPAAKKGQKHHVVLDVDEEEDEESPISFADIEKLEEAVSNLMEAVSLVAKHLSFKRFPNTLKETIECILPILSQSRGSMSSKSLKILQRFCSPLHGDSIQTIHFVFAHILPFLALDPNDKDLNNKDLVLLKDISFNVVERFIDKFGDKILPLVKGLIQNVCMDVVDRAEYRQRTAQTALDLMNLVPNEHQQGIIRWFLLLAHAEQAYLRLFTMEVFAILLQHDRVDVLVLAVICSQCSDASATVRAKALAILGDCIESRHPSMVEIFDTIFSNRNEPERENQSQDEEESDILDLLQSEEPVEITGALLPSASAIVSLLKVRAVDDKVYVRKNSLQLLLTISQRYGSYLDQELLVLFKNSCRDVALLIRRLMAQWFTELVQRHPENEAIQLMWTRAVLPLILDSEVRVQEKALECTDQLIIKTLGDQDNQLGWSIMDIITKEGLGSYLSKAIELWSRQQQLQPHFINTLIANVEDRGQASLTLVAIIARHTAVGNHVKTFALDYLQQNIRSTNPAIVYCVQQVYKVIGAALPKMTKEQQQTVRSVSSRYISSFNLPTDMITTACDMVVFCIQQQENEEQARREAASWAKEVVGSCGEFLSGHLRKQDAVYPEEEELLARAICTLGCSALHAPKEVNKRHFLMLQHAAFQRESGVDAPIVSSQAQSQAPTRKLPPRLQAAAVISLGKMSTQHEEMAKQLIPGLGRLLETTPHEAIRNNVVCILCDWVVRYSTAIDPVMPQVTACLRDPSPAVKKQTLVLLIHLLQEDYLKIRGTFFFRILQLACDDDEHLRDLSLFYITQRLLHRQPTIIQQHFIECVFHFNDYKGHPTYNKFALTDRERKLFSIAGPSHALRRFQIYSFMLQNMDDEARFQLYFRLTRDVLHGVNEDVMSLKNASTEAVLRDALAVLSCDDIKLASLTASVDDDPAEGEDLVQAVVQSTKKAIIAQVVKRNVIENIVPIVVALKRKLATSKSPLMGNLMKFLRELMKDYKNEIQEILAEDRQLMAEIDFDLKRFEQQERAEANRQSLAPRMERVSIAPVQPPVELVNARREDEFQRRQSTRAASNNTRANSPESVNAPEQPAIPEAMEQEENSEEDVETADTETEPPAVPSPVSPIQTAEREKSKSPVPISNVEPDEAEPTEPIPGPSGHQAARREKSPTKSKSKSSKGDVAAQQDASSLPPPAAIPAPAKKRVLRPRVVSTPIRSNASIADITFSSSEADLSAIPYPDQEVPQMSKNKRRRKL